MPQTLNSEVWAGLVRRKVAPFLKRAFPDRTSFQLLLDGETLLRAPPAKAAMRENNITLLPNWPPHTPELNPQENVWPWGENELRRLEEDGDGSFASFGKLVEKAVRAYPEDASLVGSIAKRIRKMLDNKGGPIDQ